MHICWHEFNRFKSGRAKVVGHPLRGALHVGLVLAFGADAGNAQERTQFSEVFVAATLDKFCKVHRAPSERSTTLGLNLKFKIDLVRQSTRRNGRKDPKAAVNYSMAHRRPGSRWPEAGRLPFQHT